MSLASQDRRLFLVVPLIVGVAGLLDAFDGIVARVQNKESAFGDYLDHFLDRLSDLSLAAGWILGTGVRPSIGFPALVIVMLVGYSGAQLETTFGERFYEGMGRAEYVLVMVFLPALAYLLDLFGQLSVIRGGASIPEWLTIALAIGGFVTIASRIRKAREMDSQQ